MEESYYLAHVVGHAGVGMDIKEKVGQHRTRTDNVENIDRIQLGDVGAAETEPNVVEDRALTANKEKLHQKVVNVLQVEATKVEQVQVAGHVDHHVEDLAFEGDAGAAPGALHLGPEEDDGDDVEEVSNEAEDIK